MQSKATDATLLNHETANEIDERPGNTAFGSPPLPQPLTTQPVLLSPQASIAPVRQETVSLANHVSLQIFSSDATQSSKNVIVFLHGGPGLDYNESYAPVTDWFIRHGYTFIAPEIAGSGKEGLENTSNSYTLNYVRDLKAVIQYLRERQDFTGKEFCAVAHSWGGFQLASLLTDEESPDRNFFSRAVFISSNLDSAQTRLFADPYDDRSSDALINSKNQMLGNFTQRHAGRNEQIDDANKMTVISNPLIDQSLNEKFSPYYRLEKVPSNVPCLFFHATDDKQVPASQSVDAFNKINSAGGDARIVISSQGDHGFFKAGTTHDPEVMATCFSAVDTLVKKPALLAKAGINGEAVDCTEAGTLEGKLLATDGSYENHRKLLEDFHKPQALAAGTARETRMPRKREYLQRIRDAHQEKMDFLIGKKIPKSHKSVQFHDAIILSINKALEKN